MSLDYINRTNDEEIIDIVRSILDNGTGRAETFNEHLIIKLMQLRGTPIESFEYEQERVDEVFKQWAKPRTPDLADYAELQRDNLKLQEQLELCDMQVSSHGQSLAMISDECMALESTNTELRRQNKMMREDNEKMFSLIMDLREQGAANFILANGYTRIEMVLRDHQAAIKEVDGE